MIVSDAAQKVLSMLELEDEEEYNFNKAVEHINQAIYELAEENEFSFFDRISSSRITDPSITNDQDSDQDNPDYYIIPSYWAIAPGRLPLMDVIGSTWDEFAYIRRAWISVNDLQQPFREYSLEQLLDKYGDEEGQPEAFAVNGEYFYFRPIPPVGEAYTVRLLYHVLPSVYSSNDSPVPLSVMPYVVIYKACSIACLWLQDDNRIAIFETLQSKAFEKFNARQSMTNDGPSSMEDYNGET